MPAVLPNSFYYLDNFHTVLNWVGTHYRALLDETEYRFLATFRSLARPSQALLVRMVMRKGDCFRASKLNYAEIGPLAAAAGPLLAAGLIDPQPQLDLQQCCALLTKAEVINLFAPAPSRARLNKADLVAALAEQLPLIQSPEQWGLDRIDSLYALTVQPLCNRLRLLFFGNSYQDWSEFVLADLGLVRYEQVTLTPAAFVFRQRQDIDDYLYLQRCRERLEAGIGAADLVPELPASPYANAWIEARRAKLLFTVAHHCERGGDSDTARHLYAASSYPPARLRHIRTLERGGHATLALALAQAAAQQPIDAAEAQHLARILPRLRRRLGVNAAPRLAKVALPRLDLKLPRQPEMGVEVAVMQQLAHATEAGVDGQVFYVENTLLNALFGLLCWEAIFAPVAGAFFHPFQHGPADLFEADFYARRRELFEACLAQLQSGAYIDTIKRHYSDKYGLVSPFVEWSCVDAQLLELALHCVPAAHLRSFCDWLLADIQHNRAGLPDLIQFWPSERRYRMIEVKGPGDRLQDNQRRWLEHCISHTLPVLVCYVRWQDEAP